MKTAQEKGGSARLNRLNRIFAAILAGLLLLNGSPVTVFAVEEPGGIESGGEELVTVIEENSAEVNKDWEVIGEPEDPEETEEPEEPEETEDLEETEAPEETEEPDEWEEEEPVEETEPEFAEEDTEADVEELDLKEYNSVPLYFQNDYPDVMFGAGTVETSGCSITCLAMVATYLTGHEYLPDELAGYFGGRAENNMARMEYGIEKMKLPCRKAENWHVVLKELERGKVVILLVDEKSIFTDTQHFVVLTGITDDGLILVNDSNRDNYDRWDLKEKLISGFPQEDLCRGFNGAWCFDKSLMPENPFIYYEEEVYVEPRYVGMTLTMDEREMLARMVWVEARGEPIEGQQAVAEVVLNRLYAGNFQSSVESIIMAEGQFNSARFLDDAEPNQTQYEAVERALKGPYVTPINTVYFSRHPSPNGTLWGRIGGHCFSTQWLPQYENHE